MRALQIVNPQRIEVIFCNIEQVLVCSQKMLELLKPIALHWQESSTVAKQMLTIVCSSQSHLSSTGQSKAEEAKTTLKAPNRQRSCCKCTLCTVPTTTRLSR